VNSSDNLLPLLLPEGVSALELLQVLLQHFGSSADSGNRREVLYPKDPPFALRVVFSKRGEPAAAHAGEALTSEVLQGLQERIHREFVAVAGMSVNRQAYFCRERVGGWWRYRDQFQILPVPEGAPKAEFPLGDHPFLIEFRYPRAPDFFLDSCRRARLVSKLGLLLNALLVTPVKPLGGRSLGSLRFAWVLLPPEREGAELKVAYRQEGYHYEGMCNHAEDFSDVAGLPPIREVVPDDYYQWERRLGNALEVPSDLCDSFDRYYQLDAAAQDRFLNACYWLSQANQTASASMRFLAAVQAIETLVDPSTGGVKCPQCEVTKRPGPTQQFAAFLKRYVPSSGADDGGRLLYEVRSGLTHGYLPPFLTDTESLGMLHPTSDQQGGYLTLALTSARVGLRNWLWATR
jgi:hypothetical protein